MEPPASAFAKSLSLALRYSLTYLDSLDRRSVAATADLATLRARIAKSLAEEGIAADAVIHDLVRDVDEGILGSAGGRFFGWVIGGAVPAAVAADWLTAAWDQNAALYACGPAAAVVEEVAGAWLKDIFGLPSTASFAFVTGCQMAHVTCLAAARHALLDRLGWDVEEQGLSGAPSIRLLSSSHRHGSIDRAVRLLGLGGAQIIELPLDGSGRLRADVLHEALAADSGTPAIVLLQAGDINTGAFDEFDALIPVAHQHGAWVHVDGAFGLWVAASPRHRHLVQGVAAADSWATDGHKWLNVPYDAGYAFVADDKAHRAAMSHRAAYLTHDEHARDQIDWNPDWSRRARGFATYAALRQWGRHGLADLIDRCCTHAQSLVHRLGKLPGVDVLSAPIVNQGLVRFLDPAPVACDADHDRWTDRMIAEILATGEAFVGGTTWQGRRAMRVSVCNWQTSTLDIDRAVSAVSSALAARRMATQ